MQSEQPITSVPIAVGFDTRVLQVVGVAEGDFLKQGGAQTRFSSRVDPAGHILMTATRASDGGATAPPASSRPSVSARWCRPMPRASRY
jgi:general secretion pathway protein D